MKKIAGIAIYGAIFGVMWKFFIYPLCRFSQKEDEWMVKTKEKKANTGTTTSVKQE